MKRKTHHRVGLHGPRVCVRPHLDINLAWCVAERHRGVRSPPPGSLHRPSCCPAPRRGRTCAVVQRVHRLRRRVLHVHQLADQRHLVGLAPRRVPGAWASDTAGGGNPGGSVWRCPQGGANAHSRSPCPTRTASAGHLAGWRSQPGRPGGGEGQGVRGRGGSEAHKTRRRGGAARWERCARPDGVAACHASSHLCQGLDGARHHSLGALRAL